MERLLGNITITLDAISLSFVTLLETEKFAIVKCISASGRSVPNVLSGNSGSSGATMPGDQFMSMYELGELSSMHPLGSTSTLSSKVSLKSHHANNLNVVEVEGAPRRSNDVSLGECQTAGLHPIPSSPYSSPSVLAQQPLSLLSNNNGSSNSDPLLCVSTLSSMASVQQVSERHRLANSMSVTDGEAAQRCTNDVSPGECSSAVRVRTSSTFYLSPTLNISSNSSSSDSGVSI